MGGEGRVGWVVGGGGLLVMWEGRGGQAGGLGVCECGGGRGRARTGRTGSRSSVKGSCSARRRRYKLKPKIEKMSEGLHPPGAGGGLLRCPPPAADAVGPVDARAPLATGQIRSNGRNLAKLAGPLNRGPGQGRAESARSRARRRGPAQAKVSLAGRGPSLCPPRETTASLTAVSSTDHNC